MSTERELETARAFVHALDDDAFDDARPFLAEECTYVIRGRTLRGREVILSSYAEASKKARRTFDSVRYESSVEAFGDHRVRAVYVDVIVHDGREHRHRCAQVLTFGDDGRIADIRHEDLPGERDALARFMEDAGVGPPSLD